MEMRYSFDAKPQSCEPGVQVYMPHGAKTVSRERLRRLEALDQLGLLALDVESMFLQYGLKLADRLPREFVRLLLAVHLLAWALLKQCSCEYNGGG